jgi:hypothetical protein
MIIYTLGEEYIKHNFFFFFFFTTFVTYLYLKRAKKYRYKLN